MSHEIKHLLVYMYLVIIQIINQTEPFSLQSNNLLYHTEKYLTAIVAVSKSCKRHVHILVYELNEIHYLYTLLLVPPPKKKNHIKYI